MEVALNIPSVLFALFGAYVVLCNYGALIGNYLNYRRGIRRHVSLGYILPQLSLLLAYAASFLPTVRFVSSRLLLTVGIVDPSLWVLLATPFILMFTDKRR